MYGKAVFFQNTDKNALVIVLVEGDLSAIEHVKLAVENNIPVVVIEGTGGAADLLAEFMYSHLISNLSLITSVFLILNLNIFWKH